VTYPLQRVNGQQWTFNQPIAAPGRYNWQLVVTSNGGIDNSRSGMIDVLAQVGGGQFSASFPANTSATVWQPWSLAITTSVPTGAVFIQFGNERTGRLASASETSFIANRTFTSQGIYSYRLVFNPRNSPQAEARGTVVVQAAVAPPPPVVPPPQPEPIQPLTPILTKSDSVQSGIPWSARLTTNVPVYSADLVFRTGRRIPFDGGPTSWFTRDENSRFSESGMFDYELQIRRQSNSALETFGLYRLEVRPAPVPVVRPSVISASTVEQGQPYNLLVRTDVSADLVKVKWPDSASEQGLQAINAQRTEWSFGNRLFMQAQPLNVMVRAYKDGIVQPVGETTITLNVIPPAPSIRLLEISRNIVVGESPYFTVAASLSVSRVAVQVGGDAPVNLAATGGSGAEQNFRGQVPARKAGTVPYVISAYNAQGQPVTDLSGNLTVAGVGDALKVPNPIPAELTQGQSASWQFLTNQAPAEMWLEFPAPIGKLPLTGTYLTHTFNYPPGSYSYQLMRRDQLGNVFPITGASGVLRIKPGQVVTQYVSAVANGQAIREGTVLKFKSGELISYDVRTNQPIPRLFVYVQEAKWDRDFTSSDKMIWKAGMAGLPPGTYHASMYAKDLNYQPINTPVAVNFMIQIAP
jgi:hypothetical protein